MTSKLRLPLIRLTYMLIDACLIYASIFFACTLRSSTLSFPVSLPYLFVEVSNPFRFVFVFWLLTTILINHSHQLYETRRELLEGIEVWTVVRSTGLASLSIVVAQYVLKIEGLPRSIFITATVSMIIVLSVWRIIKRLFVEYLVISGYNNWNTIIIGAGKVGVAIAQEIERRPGLGIKIVGFLDDFKTGTADDHKTKILGKISDFSTIAAREFVSIVFITIHDSPLFLKLLEDARDLNITVHVVPQGYGFTTGEFYRYNIGLIPVIEYSDVHNIRKQVGKRLFDICASLALLAISWPVFLAIAVAIKLDSPGPVFYASRRFGRKGRIFRMYKFRSMVTDADRILQELKHKNEVDGPIFKMKKDPRITAFGRILRKYSLDELPQIVNVLKGEMSLVGPRPLPIEQIEKEDLRQLKRLEIRPGITGLWQVRGRSDLSFARLVKWDIWYINNWSFWLDLTILLQTIPIVVKAKGAY